jgi:branched-chain amino acid transport system substrate-binding protein
MLAMVLAMVLHLGVRMKRFLAAIGAAVVLLLAACSSSGGATSSSTGSSSSPIKYLVLLPESGPFGSYALGYRQGIQASVDVVNSEGGILGRHVDVTFEDDTGTASEAVLKLQQAQASGTINLLGAGISSIEATALFPLSTRYKIITLTSASVGSLNNPSAYPYGFADAGDMGTGMKLVAKTAQAEGVKTLGVVLGDDAYGQNVLQNLQAGVQGTGIKIVSATFADTAVNMTPSIQKVMAAKPQMLFLDANGSTVPELLKSRVSAGAVNVPTIGGQGVAHVNIVQLDPGAPLKNLRVAYWTILTSKGAPNNAALKKMDAQLAANNVKITNIIDTYTLGYDWLLYYKAAVTQAKSTDVSKVKAAMENLHVSGSAPWATWPTSRFSPTSHDPVNSANSWVIGAPGAWVNGIVTP